MTARAHIPDRVKLASCLIVILEIPHEHAKMMTADQINSLANFDHYPIPKAHDGPDEHWNLMPLTIMAHRAKTAKVDIPMIAKVDRLATARRALQGALEKPCGQKRERSSRWPQGRKIQSRPFRRRRDAQQ